MTSASGPPREVTPVYTVPDAEFASVKLFDPGCREFVVGSDYGMKAERTDLKAEINDSIRETKGRMT